MLYHEHNEDPAMRPRPIGPEQGEKVIESMALGSWERVGTLGSTGSRM